MSDLHVIWFRRDLRVHDHAALVAACASGGQVLPLYIFDTRHWHRPDTSGRQFDFLLESLADLDGALRKRGSKLCLRSGNAAEVLSQIHTQYGIASVHFHAASHDPEETERVQHVRSWAMKAGIPLREQAIRRAMPLTPGESETAFRHYMRQPRLNAPENLDTPDMVSEDWPVASDYGLDDDACAGRQTGGRTNGVLQLRQYLAGRGRPASKRNLSVMDRESSASGLSPYLNWGTLSDREVWQAAMRDKGALLSDGDETFAASLDTFVENLEQRSRLLTAKPRHEQVENAGLPNDIFEREMVGAADPRLAAWASGRTGFPLLDASMRCLQATGRLESELRSLLLSFATCHLWLDPTAPAQHLARLSTDFDGALFYGNARKVVGVSSHPVGQIRNPVRHSQMRDPEGTFIRKWIPEIADLPDALIHSPWDAPKSLLAEKGIVLGQSYPMRMVDHMAAARAARRHLFPEQNSHALPFGVPARPNMARRAGMSKSGHVHAVPAKPVQLSFDLGGHA